MSQDVYWDVNKYKEEHESDDQWQLRKEFLMKWKDHYPEERLVCLAQAFSNIEFMGCRYPNEVMHEVARLSADIAKEYRDNRKTKLQRTFVSASEAAEDKAKGVKRLGGVVLVEPPKKKTPKKNTPKKIAFIPQSKNISHENNDKDKGESRFDTLVQRMEDTPPEVNKIEELKEPVLYNNKKPPNEVTEQNKCRNFRGINYLQNLTNMKCIDPRDFNEKMFNTPFGRFVLVIRPWNDMINNLHNSCATFKLPLLQGYRNGVYKVMLNNYLLASATGDKVSAKAKAGRAVWELLRDKTVILVLKEQWVTRNETCISMNDMVVQKCDLGEPVEQSVATKMMKLMGWEGGGLGVNRQGIEEPIKPHFRMVRRAGLGTESESDEANLKRIGLAFMRCRKSVVDSDLVFASDFTSKERAILHQCASQCGLTSRSYGKGEDRFLVVSHKFRPLPLVRAILECGGDTPKYRVFVPATIDDPEAWTQLQPVGQSSPNVS